MGRGAGVLSELVRWLLGCCMPQDAGGWDCVMRAVNCYLIAPLTFVACLVVSALGIGLIGYLMVAGLVAVWAHGRAKEILSTRQELEQMRQALRLYVSSQERVAAIRKASSS